MNRENIFQGKRILILSGAVIIVVVLVLMTVLSATKKAYIEKEMKAKAAVIKAGQGVRVVTARRSPGIRSVTLVGEARPYASVTQYAKISGYLKEIKVDKGDRVHEGQIIAVIESPEIDRQYDAALADAQNKRTEAARAKELVEKKYISQQDADNAEAAARVAEATAEGLKTQKDYEILRAPFSATVTARFADPGALVQSAVSSQTTALPIVTLSKVDRLRVYVYLDQRDAAFVRVGDHADIFDAARPEVKLPASVNRLSGELDPKTRTLLTELDLDNRQSAILAGSFVQVSLTLKTTPSIEVPADALLTKDGKTIVGVISTENRVSFRPVGVLESDGKVVRLRSGLEEGERVVLNPGFGISEGEQVQPVETTAE